MNLFQNDGSIHSRMHVVYVSFTQQYLMWPIVVAWFIYQMSWTLQRSIMKQRVVLIFFLKQIGRRVSCSIKMLGEDFHEGHAKLKKIRNGSSKIKKKRKTLWLWDWGQKSLTPASSEPPGVVFLSKSEVPATLIFVISLLFGISLWLKTCAFHSFHVSQDISMILITNARNNIWRSNNLIWPQGCISKDCSWGSC